MHKFLRKGAGVILSLLLVLSLVPWCALKADANGDGTGTDKYFLQAVTHELHSVQEQSQSSQKRYNIKNVHIIFLL